MGPLNLGHGIKTIVTEAGIDNSACRFAIHWPNSQNTAAMDTDDYHAYECTPLQNGIRVLFEPIPYVPSSCVTVWLGMGSVQEAQNEAGMSHFIEHLFFKGTSTRSARRIMEEIEGRGGHLNAFTSRDYMCIYARVLAEHTANALEIIADILKDSQFYDFEKEKNVVLEEIASCEDVPEDFIHDLFLMHLWPNHSLGRPVMGFHESVEQLTKEQAWAFYKKWCKPQNIIIAVAGKFSENEIYQQIERLFGDMPRGELPTLPAPPVAVSNAAHLEREIGQSHVCLGFPAPSMLDKKRYVCELLSSILGGGSTSRLFDKIREQEGLAYAIYSFRSSYTLAGCLGVYAAVTPENLPKTLSLISDELKKIQDEFVPEEEVLLNQEQIRGGMLLALENTSNRASHLARSIFYHGRIITPHEILEEIYSVTPEDIRQHACEVLNPSQCTKVILGPRE